MKEITINNRVVEVLHQKFHLPHDILIQKNWDKPLTEEPFYFSDIEMVYLLFELEKSYGMCVKSEDMDDYGYSTIRKITNIMEGI
ncbi:hypothetical protein GCM10023142_01720 [Anaerocolumna aminovalerica]|jgi:hypothetical protein|uniref:Acyl carrier protein n=1 Tax=Anaerocolumna aminovalerica TaxID=1527 RepID=A0A1I5BIL4_9FIRM|nr:hypothetical protein [Anaerocolumna aminovalerica]MDU6265749.1 hypothetical protein [Anaerocolumna aminovalerica]SFN74563.1 hypothetical protein SAMN04489757_10130 [Anaerocolumna aminovalerica]